MRGIDAITIIVVIVLVWALFFSPLRIPSWLRTLFAIILAVFAFLWLLSLLGIVAFPI